MKRIDRTPIEYFCHDCGKIDATFELDIKQQFCKYVNGTCVKPRKSTPEVKVGICTVGASVNKKELQPVIICPQRFKEEQMFNAIREKYLSDWENVMWIPEVDMGVGGSVDYVAVELDRNQQIRDFQCVEIQAAGTTGTPYPYIQDFQRYHDFSHGRYTYGINWANEFSKTMMQQAYKKGKIVQSWKRKIIFVIQDVAMDYLQCSSDCSKVTSFVKDNPVDFCVFSLSWFGDRWGLEFKDIYSTTIEGIETIIGGAPEEKFPTVEEFKEKILKKGISDRLLRNIP
ncbi:MAG: hypothetical protein IJ562_09335 [Prevotella sp.]|nr:hypothetical protein [Prevotella sp.]